MVKSGYRFKVRLILALSLALALFPSNPGLAAVYRIPPSVNLFVDSQNPETNFQNPPELKVSYYEYYPGYWDDSLTQRIYLQFDLGSVPSNFWIIGADLYLYVARKEGAIPNPTVDLYHIKAPWSKSTVTWYNQPDPGPYLGFRNNLSPGLYYAWDLMQSKSWDFVADMADGKVSLMLLISGEAHLHNSAGFAFNGSAAPDNHPILEVRAIPNPGAVHSSTVTNLLLWD